jgi:phosphoglycolate phosphatase
MNASPVVNVSSAAKGEPTTLPRAVLFDWDNTLIDSWGCIRAALNATLRWGGLPEWSEEETRARVRLSLRDSFPALFGDRWTEAREIYHAEFEARHLDMLRPMPGAEDLLSVLQGAGIYMGVVSNKTGRFLRAEAEALGWTRYFGRLVGATDAPADKPAIDPVRLALEPAGLEPGPEVWFIGDADVDMQCAHMSKCVPLLLGDSTDAHETYPPACRFENCFTLTTLARGLCATISQESSVEIAR